MWRRMIYSTREEEDEIITHLTVGFLLMQFIVMNDCDCSDS
jgi:hypothetical protein